ncbi:MAG: hypothetical protein ACFHX7_22095 [Pseudomonadota bacterium]
MNWSEVYEWQAQRLRQVQVVVERFSVGAHPRVHVFLSPEQEAQTPVNGEILLLGTLEEVLSQGWGRDYVVEVLKRACLLVAQQINDPRFRLELGGGSRSAVGERMADLLREVPRFSSHGVVRLQRDFFKEVLSEIVPLQIRPGSNDYLLAKGLLRFAANQVAAMIYHDVLRQPFPDQSWMRRSIAADLAYWVRFQLAGNRIASAGASLADSAVRSSALMDGVDVPRPQTMHEIRFESRYGVPRLHVVAAIVALLVKVETGFVQYQRDLTRLRFKWTLLQQWISLAATHQNKPWFCSLALQLGILPMDDALFGAALGRVISRAGAWDKHNLDLLSGAASHPLAFEFLVHKFRRHPVKRQRGYAPRLSNGDFRRLLGLVLAHPAPQLLPYRTIERETVSTFARDFGQPGTSANEIASLHLLSDSPARVSPGSIR